MSRALQFFRKALEIAGFAWVLIALVLFLNLSGQVPGWFGGVTGAIFAAMVFYIAISMARKWMLAPTEKETAEKDRAWLSEINRDYARLRTVEDRLDELERLKRRDMVTPEEYAAKRQEILKDL